jgi:hypothetical protein
LSPSSKWRKIHGQIKQKDLESAGWRFGDAADFLEMTNEERRRLDERVERELKTRRKSSDDEKPNA